jgi:hypothetical protein
MINSSRKLALSLSLLTAGIGLMLTGISWIMLFGIALTLSDFRTPWTVRKAAGVSIALILVALNLIQSGFSTAKTPLEGWYIAVLAGVWCYGLFDTFRRWRQFAPANVAAMAANQSSRS